MKRYLPQGLKQFLWFVFKSPQRKHGGSLTLLTDFIGYFSILFNKKRLKPITICTGLKNRSNNYINILLESLNKCDHKDLIHLSIYDCGSNDVSNLLSSIQEKWKGEVTYETENIDFSRSYTFNKALKQSKTELLFACDADMELPSNLIELINKYAPQIKLVICSSAPENVVQRAIEAKFDMYWWNPIVDAPQQENSLTRQIHAINKKSCMNTGGTVGTAAWLFTNAILKIPKIAITGMDLGYHNDTPLEMTQTYYELQEFVKDRVELEKLFPQFTFPLTGETFYTDPTYFWYRKNFLELFEKAVGLTINCSEAGTLFADTLPCMTFDNFLTQNT